MTYYDSPTLAAGLGYLYFYAAASLTFLPLKISKNAPYLCYPQK